MANVIQYQSKFDPMDAVGRRVILSQIAAAARSKNSDFLDAVPALLWFGEQSVRTRMLGVIKFRVDLPPPDYIYVGRYPGDAEAAQKTVMDVRAMKFSRFAPGSGAGVDDLWCWRREPVESRSYDFAATEAAAISELETAADPAFLPAMEVVCAGVDQLRAIGTSRLLNELLDPATLAARKLELAAIVVASVRSIAAAVGFSEDELNEMIQRAFNPGQVVSLADASKGGAK